MSTLALPSATAHRLLTAPDGGPLPRLDRHRLAALLAEAGLTGRGGAGFPTAHKLAVFLDRPRGPVVVVGNAMEGEPLSHKDAVLLQANPGLVLDGLQVVARALGSDHRPARAILALGPQVPPAAVRAAAAEPSRAGAVVEVRVLPGGFVAGQETALVRALDGERAVPRDRRDPVSRRGVDRRPTLVLNAETLAHVALVARHGAGWWRSSGSPDDPGTMLVSISGTRPDVVRAPGVVEVERGAPLRAVLARTGTATARVQAVLVGGYHGAWVPAAALDVPLSRAGLAPWGAAPGAGVLHVLDRADCPLDVVARITGYLADEGAGQCGPCANGLPALAGALATHAPAARVAHLAAAVDGRGACSHPDGTARLVRSTLHVFADHVHGHADGRCPR